MDQDKALPFSHVPTDLFLPRRNQPLGLLSVSSFQVSISCVCGCRPCICRWVEKADQEKSLPGPRPDKTPTHESRQGYAISDLGFRVGISRRCHPHYISMITYRSVHERREWSRVYFFCWSSVHMGVLTDRLTDT